MITRSIILSQLWIVCLFQASALEYCLMERFEASCPQESFILIKSAYYGRMKMGRCLTRDYYIGCHADVTAHLDTQCSGRTYCHLSVPEHRLLKVVPCPQDLVFYLQVDFTCVTGQSASPKTCAEEKLLRISDSKIGYLTSDFTLSTEMGSSRCPWQIIALPGQRINITLFNLRTAPTEATNNSTSGTGQTTTTGTRTKRCPNVLATVRESTAGGATLEEIVCASAARETAIYLSQANSLTIVMSPTKGSSVHSSVKYIFKYEVTGCPEPEVPPGTYMTRDGDQAFFYCSHPDRQQFAWKMSCLGTEWVGQSVYCVETTNQPFETDSTTAVKEETINILQLSAQQAGIGTVLIIGVSVGIILGICFLFTLSSIWHSYFSSFHADDPSSPAPDDVTWKRICPMYSLRMWTSESCGNDLHLRYMRRRTTGHDGVTVGVGEEDADTEAGGREMELTMPVRPTTQLLRANSIVYVDFPDSAAAAAAAARDDDDDDGDVQDIGYTDRRKLPHAEATLQTKEKRRTSLTSDIDLLNDLAADAGLWRTMGGRRGNISCIGKSPPSITETTFNINMT